MGPAQVAAMVGSAAVASAVAVVALIRIAPSLGLVDAPGGRKAHAESVPLVGGIAIFVAFFVAAWAFGLAPHISLFLFALSIVIAVGLWDDVTDISPRLKFVIQIVAASIMILGAGIQLSTVGDLLGWRPIGLSVLAVPLTIFAVVGVVNAVNMMDGIDGLAGSISLVALTWYAVVAAQSGLGTQAMTSLILAGAIAGFLVFNLRFPWQQHARAFLGDAGSLMLGFALAWLAIDLTQGHERSFTPIAALWVLVLPLVDCVSLMIRRLRAGKNPFVADRHHIHHYLLARGLSHSQTLAILLAISVMSGAAGYFAWILKLPDFLLFYPFFFGFLAYHVWIQREWERIQRREARMPSKLPEEKQGSPAAS